MSQRHDASTPEWFVKAMEQKPEAGRLDVEGAAIDWAAWGERGRPGLLLLIGNGAHMGWWRATAPLLAQDYRVVTFNWSGMGSSGWRDEYRIETFIAEAFAIAEETGLFDGPQKPLMAAHSFGGFLGLQTLALHGARFRGGMLIDSRLRIRSRWGSEAPAAPPFNVYATREQAIARFRLKPEQPKCNAFILDMLASESLEEVDGGWSWRADPDFRRKTPLGADLIPLLGKAPCPLILVRGQLSSSVTDDIWADQKAAAPPGTPFVEIPAAYHHLMIDQPIALVSVMRALFDIIPENGRWKP